MGGNGYDVQKSDRGLADNRQPAIRLAEVAHATIIPTARHAAGGRQSPSDKVAVRRPYETDARYCNLEVPPPLRPTHSRGDVRRCCNSESVNHDVRV
jgi:hypothetical protein